MKGKKEAAESEKRRAEQSGRLCRVSQSGMAEHMICQGDKAYVCFVCWPVCHLIGCSCAACHMSLAVAAKWTIERA